MFLSVLISFQIFGVDSISFPKLPEYVNRHLAPPEPIVLRYSFDPSVSPPESERPSAWDVEIKMEDAALKSRMGVMLHMNKDSTVALGKMDEEVGHVICRVIMCCIDFLFHRSLSSPSHYTTHISNELSSNHLPTIQQSLFKRGWNLSPEIWKAFWGPVHRKGLLYARKNYGGANSSVYHGLKRCAGYSNGIILMDTNAAHFQAVSVQEGIRLSSKIQ